MHSNGLFVRMRRQHSSGKRGIPMVPVMEVSSGVGIVIRSVSRLVVKLLMPRLFARSRFWCTLHEEPMSLKNFGISSWQIRLSLSITYKEC
jgi:hypothetical protein